MLEGAHRREGIDFEILAEGFHRCGGGARDQIVRYYLAIFEGHFGDVLKQVEIVALGLGFALLVTHN